jgi:hypothetical protein
MAFYGADVEQLHAFGKQLSAAAESLEGTRSKLHSAVTGARWMGPDGEQFRGSWSARLTPALVKAAASLRETARVVHENADDQTRTSNSLGGGAGGGAGGASGSGSSGSGASDSNGTTAPGTPSPIDHTSTAKGTEEAKTDNGTPGHDATSGHSSKVGVGVSHNEKTGETTVSGDASTKGWKDLGHGFKGTIGVDAGSSVTTGHKSEDGFTTTTVKTDAHAGVTGGIEKNGTGVSGGFSGGLTSDYQVTAPDGVDPTSVNPADPKTMPVGSSVTVNGGHYTQVDLNGSYHHLAIDSSAKDTNGMSTVVERTGENTVRVMAGPTEALENKFAGGVDFDAVKFMLSNTTTLEGKSLHTAEFDLSTPQGAEAYQHYLQTGEVPAAASTGVSGTTTVQSLDYNSASSVGYDAPTGGDSFKIGENSGTKVLTTFPDGSSSQVLDVKYGDRDMHMAQSFDAAGNEDTSARLYTFNATTDNLSTQMINSRDWFPEGVVSGQVTEGQHVTLTFTEAQMSDLAEKLRTADPMSAPMGIRDENMTPFELASIFARTSADDHDLILRISEVNRAQRAQ